MTTGKILTILVGIAALGGIGFAGYRFTQRPRSSSTSLSTAECSSTAFMQPITNLDTIAYISIGKLVLDPRFTYLSIKDGQRIPVYAPADGTLTRIFYKKRLDEAADVNPDYDLVFTAACQTVYRLNHVTDPNPDLAALKPITEPLMVGSNGIIDLTDDKITPRQRATVKAGEQIGTTTGTSEAHNWDFSVYINNRAVCPYEQLAEPDRSAWLAKLGDKNGIVPGTACDISPDSP